MSLLTEGLEKLNINYDEVMLERCEDFYLMLIEKNKVMNLTSITEHDDFIVKHIFDSLLSVKFYSYSNQKVIDVGTGAGFPGIPLKIFFPSLDMVLLDSLNKRLNFINEVIDKLGFENISTVHGRAEDLARDPSFREKFDLGLSRAVADLSVLSELGLPFIKKGGKFIFYKSSDIDEEVKKAGRAINILGASKPETYESILYGSDILRKFVFVDKIKTTPGKYPRKAGTPAKDPL